MKQGLVLLQALGISLASLTLLRKFELVLPLMTDETKSLVYFKSPHWLTTLKVVSFFTFSNCVWKVQVLRSVASKSSMKLTLKRSPKQLPMCFPWITSSGEQQVAHEDSLVPAAERAQMFWSLGKLTNIEPDSQVSKQNTSLLYLPLILLNVVIRSLAYMYVLGKAISPVDPWSEKKMKMLSSTVLLTNLPVPLPARQALSPTSTALKTSGVTQAPLQSILTPWQTSTPGLAQVGLLKTFPGKGFDVLEAISSYARRMILLGSIPFLIRDWQAWKTSD